MFDDEVYWDIQAEAGARTQGRLAHVHGKPVSTNPYGPDEPALRGEWFEGWEDED